MQGQLHRPPPTLTRASAASHRPAAPADFARGWETALHTKAALSDLAALRRKRREFIVCADWNTCHQNIDLKNWRSNQKNSGFMPHERAWLDRIYDDLKWVDIFREITDEPDLYTWWSNRGQAWANNVGWRLDYMLVTPGLSGIGRSQSIYRDERFSDHAPLTIDFAIPKPK